MPYYIVNKNNVSVFLTQSILSIYQWTQDHDNETDFVVCKLSNNFSSSEILSRDDIKNEKKRYDHLKIQKQKELEIEKQNWYSVDLCSSSCDGMGCYDQLNHTKYSNKKDHRYVLKYEYEAIISKLESSISRLEYNMD